MISAAPPFVPTSPACGTRRSTPGCSDHDDARYSLRRPESGDPYSVSSRFGTVAEAFCHHERRWLWVPAFAGTTSSFVGTTQQRKEQLICLTPTARFASASVVPSDTEKPRVCIC